ncbi:MAG: replicative DNA helicase, partial [Candidatus Paceibacteria bacterium]
MANDLKIGAENIVLGAQIKMPPQSIEAEISILGSLMLDKEAIYKVADIIKPEDFYRENHRLIFETMIDLFAKREPIDILSLTNKLKEKDLLQTIGGTSYLTTLVNSVASASNIMYYAEVIRKKRTLRDIISASQEINELGYHEERDSEEILDEVEQKIFSIASRASKKILSLKELLDAAWERIDKLHKTKGELRGIPTGFRDLDNLLAGLQHSDLIILAARPSLGKTALALDITRNAAIKHNIPVGFFSLEMDMSQVVDRFVAAEADVSLWHLRQGKLSTESDDFQKIRE